MFLSISSKAQSQWIIDNGLSQFPNSFLKNNTTPLSTTTASFLSIEQNYTLQNYRTIFYGGNIGISQDKDTFGHFKGKWSFTGKYNKYIGSSIAHSPPKTFLGLNYLVNYHRWGDYAAHFGLRSATTDLNLGESGFEYTDSDLKHAVITWGYEIDSTPNRLIFQSMKGVDHQGSTTLHSETKVMTILHSGHVGLGISEPLSQFVIKPISGNSYNSALSILHSANDVKVTLDYSGLVEIVGTDGFDMFNVFSQNGANILKIKDSTITSRSFQRFFSPAGTNDTVSFFSLFNNVGDTLLSMKEGGTLSLPQMATSNHQTLFLNTLGEVYAMNSSGPNPNLSWIPSGNTFGGGATTQTLGTWSYTDINLMTGGTVLGTIYGGNNYKKGHVELKNNVAIGGSTAYMFAETDTNFTLVLKTTADRSDYDYTNKGPLVCLNADDNEIFSVKNGSIVTWPGTSGSWTFTNGYTFTNGDILPEVADIDNIGSSSLYYDHVYTDEVNCNSIGTLSDVRLKHDIVPISSSLNKILELNPVSFRYNHRLEGERKIHGFIAQDVAKVIPELIAIPELESEKYVFYLTELIPFLTKAMQEQQIMIDSLNSKVDLLFSSQLQQQHLKDGSTKVDIINKQPILFQNHPNPFQGSTFIDYFVPKELTNAFLKITDNNGKLVQAFSIQSTGYGQIELDCKNLKPGTYYYSLIVNEKNIATKSMVIIGW